MSLWIVIIFGRLDLYLQSMSMNIADVREVAKS
jgi:hypothetical protein